MSNLDPIQQLQSDIETTHIYHSDAINNAAAAEMDVLKLERDLAKAIVLGAPTGDIEESLIMTRSKVISWKAKAAVMQSRAERNSQILRWHELRYVYPASDSAGPATDL